jgi:hypothetical protein
LSVTQVVGPANDEASGAEVIPALPVVLQPDFTNATSAGDPSLCYGSWYGGLWYRYTPPTTQLVTFQLASTATDAAVGFAVGSPPFVEVTCLARAFWNSAPVPLWLQGGQDYYFLFAAGGVDPNIMLTIGAPTPPANDALADATLVTALPFADTVNTEAATSEEEAPYGCFGPGADVWYRFAPDRDLTLDVDLSETAGSVGAEVFRVLDSHTEHMGCTDEKFLRQVLEAGQTYVVRVLRLDAPGSMTVAFREGPPPLDITATVAPNGTLDRVAGAVTISGTTWCNLTASDAWIYLKVRQRVGRTTLITGEADGPIACGPNATTWSVKVYGSNGPFGAGSVSVAWSVSAQNAYDYANATGTTTVRVKGR